MEVTIDYNGQMVSVEVTEEVFAFLNYADHKEENLVHEQRRHWDGREFDEYIVQKEGCIRFVQSPEQELCHKETMQVILRALEHCTERQRSRFLLYALDGMSYTQIGNLCGCSKVAVHYSIEAVRKKCKEYLADYLNNLRFSG